MTLQAKGTEKFMKNVKFAAAVMALVFIGIFGIFKFVTYVGETLDDPTLDKEQAEVKAAKLLYTPATCSGDRHAWQCRNLPVTEPGRWVTCEGRTCQLLNPVNGMLTK